MYNAIQACWLWTIWSSILFYSALFPVSGIVTFLRRLCSTSTSESAAKLRSTSESEAVSKPYSMSGVQTPLDAFSRRR
ncbi:hypothetical protein B0H11DRAFT_2031863 [Mycena galericulata]|nr:hypothetical protein B0H11DRAFT_2031863 [Mycena galericulata]